MKFKVLMGSYQAPSVQTPEGHTYPVVYNPGSVVESSLDLARKFNSPGAKKFQRLPDDVPVFVAPAEGKTAKEDDTEIPGTIPSPPEPEVGEVLMSLSVPELREEAEAAGVSLRGLRTKAEIVAALRENTEEEEDLGEPDE
jgi:hypothetical protein